MATEMLLWFVTDVGGLDYMQVAFGCGTPFQVKIEGSGVAMSLTIHSISPENGIGEQLLFVAVEDGQAYQGYWNSNSKRGWVQPIQSVTSFLAEKSGTVAEVKNGPNLTSLITSFGIQNHVDHQLQLTVNWPWGVVWYPKEVPFIVTGIEKGESPNCFNLIGTLQISRRLVLRVVVVNYNTHSRIGRIIVYG